MAVQALRPLGRQGAEPREQPTAVGEAVARLASPRRRAPVSTQDVAAAEASQTPVAPRAAEAWTALRTTRQQANNRGASASEDKPLPGHATLPKSESSSTYEGFVLVIEGSCILAGGFIIVNRWDSAPTFRKN